jgi:methylmalonyl-CoA/ethylmalonyl-CoA epimerase
MTEQLRIEEMKIEKVEHIGIAVKSIDKAAKFYRNTLNLKISEKIDVPQRKIRIAFVQISEMKLELLESMAEGSVIDKFIQKKGEGIHHICFEVEDCDKVIAELKDKKVELVEEPRIGAEGKRIVFLQPKNAFGVLIELKEK